MKDIYRTWIVTLCKIVLNLLLYNFYDQCEGEVVYNNNKKQSLIFSYLCKHCNNENSDKPYKNNNVKVFCYVPYERG